jgi:hypothetical protein
MSTTSKSTKRSRLNHRREKYLERQVTRLRIHPRIIQLKRIKRDFQNRLFDDILEAIKKDRSDTGINSKERP